jgi:hypothetical protein
MKQLHHYTPQHYSQPTKLEWAMFGLSLVAAGLLLGLLCSGCATAALPGETQAEAKLDTAQARQLSAASASVQAAGQANAANPPGAPQTAVAGELSVANANLPAPQPADAKEALARVNAALTGQLADAQKGWNAAVAKGTTLDAQVDLLQKQVVAERAAEAASAKKATERLCIIAALVVGGALSVAAALSLAAGLYFSLPKLEYGAAGLGLGGVAAFFAATQVGTAHFNLLAMIVLIGGVAALVYTVWGGFAGGSTLQTKAQGFDAAITAVRDLAGEVAADTEAGAKKLWHWLSVELDAAHKALIADWDKLEAFFTGKTATVAAPTVTTTGSVGSSPTPSIGGAAITQPVAPPTIAPVAATKN